MDALARLNAALSDRYTIERELTGGGMSRLFLATERSLNRRVVIKVLPPDAFGSAGAERFQREVELLARLQHPHIVPVHAAGRTDDLAYYVMPFVSGESLAARLAREGPLPVEQGIAIIREVADALAFAHEHGVIHRDVKPANILLEAGHAVVTDFGIAHVVSAGASAPGAGPRLTATGLSIGTVGYMAPEQFVGAGEIDARADVYALGVVGYECLTGRSPFATSGGAPSLAPQLRAHPASPERSRPGSPARVAAALLKALAPDPDERFATMAEFREALGGPARRRRYRKEISVAIAVAVVSVIATGVASRVLRDSRAGAASTRTADILAVAPFEVLRPDLALWREGMVDVLSRNLDGMGPLRSAQPSAVVPRWKGRPDFASAVALGRSVGAGLVVVGTLEGAGRDSVRVQLSVVDVAAARAVAELSRTGDAEHMDVLTDSVTMDLVRALARVRRITLTRASGMGASSLAALKVFLQGEQLFRRGDFDSAVVSYEEALRIDPGFALAGHGLASALTSWGGGADSARAARALSAALGAMRNAHRLPRHDSLTIGADTLQLVFQRLISSGRLLDDYGLAAVAERLVAERRQIVREYPDDPKALYELADLYFHFGWQRSIRVPDDSVIALLDRAVASDSGYAEGYLHLVLERVLRSQNLDDALPLVDAYVRRSPRAMWAGAYAALASVARAPGARAASVLADAAARAAPGDSYVLIDIPGVSTRAGLLDTLWAPCVANRTALSGCRGRLLSSWHLHGRDRIAARADPSDVGALPLEFLEHIVTADSMRAFFDAPPGGTSPVMLVLVATVLRDTSRFERAARALLAPVTGLFARDRRAWLARIGALRQLAHGNPAGAAAAFDSVPNGRSSVDLLLPFQADALVGAGRDADALRQVDVAGIVSLPFVRLRIARLAGRLGDRKRAARAWQWVATWYGDADPAYDAIRREARDALARYGDVPVPVQAPKRP
jgi:serine/threonine-protein kinase